MSKYDLSLRTTLLNAAGSLGFSPDPRGPVDLERLGAFFTNPVSLGRRTPAHGERCLPFEGGFLLHTGYPNPGLEAVIRWHARRWESASLPVVVHLLPQQADEVPRMLRRLEDVEGVAGYELGLPPDLDAAGAAAFVRAAAGERPVIARLPLERAAGLAGAAAQAGAVAVSLAPPPRDAARTGRAAARAAVRPGGIAAGPGSGAGSRPPGGHRHWSRRFVPAGRYRRHARRGSGGSTAGGVVVAGGLI